MRNEKETADLEHDRRGAQRQARVMTTAWSRLRALGPGLMCARCEHRPWSSIVQSDSGGYRQFCDVCREDAHQDRREARQRAMRGRNQ